MKLQKRTWIAVGTMAALGIGAGSAVAAPMLNATEAPAGVTGTPASSSASDSANSPSSADSPATAASASSPATANSP
ncbi:hypothetical protein E1269_08370, partial [Jiangella asiatica]